MFVIIIVGQGALSVRYIPLGNVLGGQFLDRFVVVIDLALLVVLLIQSVFFIPVNVFTLDYFPNVKELNGIIHSILYFQVVLFGLLEANLEQGEKLLWQGKLLLDGSHQGELQSNVLDRVIVHKAALSEVL